MLTERTIINALIIGATFVVAPFIISSTLTVDYVPAIIFLLLAGFLSAFFIFKDTLCLGPIMGCSMALSLNFLPLPLDSSHAAAVMLILYYVTGYILIRQRKTKLGKPAFLWPIVILVGILLYHNHSLALKSMGGEGGETQGARPAYLIYLMTLGYFCAINIKSPTVELFSKLPLYTVYAAIISSIPFFLSTMVPGAAPYLHLITNSLNYTAYAESQSNSTGDAGETMGRVAAFAGLALPVQSYLLCRYPMGTWIRPERWWIAAVSLVCLFLVVSSGYRNNLFVYLLFLCIANLCYYSWRSVVLPAGVALMGLLFVSASENNIIPLPVDKLPMMTQRTMSFLPLDWSPDAIQSAGSSNEFRDNIKRVYIKEYLWRSPLVGIGYNIDAKVFNSLTDGLLKRSWGNDSDYIQAKTFIEGQMYHTGWISLYDTVGIVGFIAFLILGMSEIWVSGVFVFGLNADRRSSLFPLYVWMFINILTMMIAYFTVFGDFAITFTNMLIYAMVLSHILDLRETREVPIASASRKTSPESSRSMEARYGYQSRY